MMLKILLRYTPYILNLIPYNFQPYYLCYCGDRGSTVVKVLYYKSEGRWFDFRCCH